MQEIPPTPEGGWIMVIGDYPDRMSDEARTLRESRDYSFLSKIFKNLGIEKRVWYHSAVRCSPIPFGKANNLKPKDVPTKTQIGHCSKILTEDIAAIKPKAIITVGPNGTQAALGRRDILSIATQRFERADGIPVFPVWGVSYVRRDHMRLLEPYGAQWEKVLNKIDNADAINLDLSMVQPVVGWTLREVKAWFEPVIENLSQLKTKADRRKTPLCWDTEGRRNRPYGKDFAVSMFSFYHPSQEQPLIIPVDHIEASGRFDKYVEENKLDFRTWEDEKARILKWLLPNVMQKRYPKIGHNLKFDENVVNAVYHVRVEGFEADTQLLAYCLNPTRVGYFGLDDLCREMVDVPEYWLAIKKWQEQKSIKGTPVEFDYTRVPWDILVPYAAWDAVTTYMIYREITRRLKRLDMGSWFVNNAYNPPKKNTFSVYDYAFECRRYHHLLATEMEFAGLSVDDRLVESVGLFYRDLKDEADKALNGLPEVVAYDKQRRTEGAKPNKDRNETEYHINWGSPPQLKDFFIRFLKLPVVNQTKTGGDSTDAYALKVWAEKHKSVVAKKLIEYREAAKFLTTYIDNLYTSDWEKRLVQMDNLVHSDFKCTSTATGRLSSARPNMQNLPRRGLVKRLYNSRFKDGWILQRDYSGLEVRILALMSRDKNLLRIYHEGGDVHFYTQKHFFGDKADKKNKEQRVICKSALFGKVYGQGDKGLFDLLTKNGVISPRTGKPITYEECTEFNQMLEKAYPGVADYIARCHSAAMKMKWCSTAFGFVRPLPEMHMYDQFVNLRESGDYESDESRELSMKIGDAKRQSQNSPIQGTAGDLTVFAAYLIGKALRKRREKEGKKALLVNCVHDSIYVDCPREEVAEVNAIMAAIMDNCTEWLPQLLPGYDCSWIDIPIIGEFEMGVDSKDCVTAIEEVSLINDDKVLKFKIPRDEKTDVPFVIPKNGGDHLVWDDDHEAIRTYLTNLRQENIWHGKKAA
jgi:uracil-DNA glycosylase family 4